MPEGNFRSCLVCLGNAMSLGPFPAYMAHDPIMCPRDDLTHGDGEQNEDLLLYCPSRIWAFSLRQKTWELVQPDDLCDVPAQDAAWNELQTEEEECKVHLDAVVSAFFGDRKKSKQNPSDGKGNDMPALSTQRRGCNVLLHGKSGTGKTFTAGKHHPSYLIRFPACS